MRPVRPPAPLIQPCWLVMRLRAWLTVVVEKKVTDLTIKWLRFGLRLFVPPLITHFFEYLAMILFTAVYTAGKCLPSEAPSPSLSSSPTPTPTGQEGYELRGWSESMYFALTTQTTVGCAGAQQAHAWRVARAIARARCAFLENPHSLTQIWRHHRR